MAALAVWRMRQQRLPGLRFRDQRTAMAVGRRDKASGHVVTEERDRAACRRSVTVSVPPVSVFRVGERRLRAERNVQEIDAVLGAETGHRAGECGRLIEHQLACPSR